MKRAFDKVIGTGGIGTGEIYRLEGNHTLGREESRAGHLQDNRDFCKLHIVLHYIAVLTKNVKSDIRIIPVSAVGDDARGKRVVQELIKAGMDTTYVKTFTDTPTLHSVCFQYSDGSGGNITESHSACSKVDLTLLKSVEKEIDSNTLLVALPEVPLQSRLEFIKIGAMHNAFIVASFTSSEIKEIEHYSVLQHIDLLSINMDEARMFSGLGKDLEPLKVVEACMDKLQDYNPNIKLTVTNGSEGAYAYENGKIDFMPVYPVKAVNSAGAGDAFLAGLIIGTIKLQAIIKDSEDSCLKLATALAGMSVTSKDTIHFGITNDSLEIFITHHSGNM